MLFCHLHQCQIIQFLKKNLYKILIRYVLFILVVWRCILNENKPKPNISFCAINTYMIHLNIRHASNQTQTSTSLLFICRFLFTSHNLWFNFVIVTAMEPSPAAQMRPHAAATLIGYLIIYENIITISNLPFSFSYKGMQNSQLKNWLHVMDVNLNLNDRKWNLLNCN